MIAFLSSIVGFHGLLLSLNRGFLHACSWPFPLSVLKSRCTSVLDNFSSFCVKIYWNFIKNGKYRFTKYLLIFMDAFQNEFSSVCCDIHRNNFGM